MLAEPTSCYQRFHHSIQEYYTATHFSQGQTVCEIHVIQQQSKPLILFLVPTEIISVL